jgi:small subunit ribosomal protein S9
MTVATKTAKKTTAAKPTGNYFYGVGRRKASNVRAKYYPGTDAITVVVDGKKMEEYFPVHFQKVITTFLDQSGVKEGTIHLFARGGGVSGQTDAARLAIAKSFVKFNEGLKPVLKAFDFLRTDVLKVLSKKAGLRKARKREQWSKR